MSSPTDVRALEARLDIVHDHVLALHSRVTQIEGEHRDELPATTPSEFPTPSSAPTEPGREPTAEQVEIPVLFSSDLESTPAAPSATETRHEPEPESKPKPKLASHDDSPVRLLAASGGLALLLGLVCLAVYAIEQDWLSPGVRLLASLLVSAGLTMAAWPLARRTHAHVAGAIGGAGLGAWIASWLVARHVHDLVSGPQVFVALGAGVVACLLIADRLRLRLMAILAALAACATPVLVGGRAADGLNELMLYQLALVSVAMVIDWRQRWSELPSLALVATWMMGARWVVNHGNPDNAIGFMTWVFVMLLATTVSAWRGLTASADALEEAVGVERSHARVRLVLGGLVTWAAAAAAFIDSPATIGMGTLGLALWHLGLAGILHRRALARGAELGLSEAVARDEFVTGLVGLAWVQALLAGPLALEGATLAWWWIALSAGAAGWAIVARDRPRLAALGELGPVMIAGPSLLTVLYCVANESEPWAFALGGIAAALPLVSSLVLARSEDSSTARAFGPGQRPHPALALVASLIWAGFALALGSGSFAAHMMLGMVPVVVLGTFACVQPSAAALRVASLVQLAASCVVMGGVVETVGLSPFAADNWGLALVALALGGLGVGLVVRARQARDLTQLGTEFDLETFVGRFGLLAAASLGLGLAFAASAVCGGLGASPAMARFGHTLAIALTGLGLLAAGLAWSEENWRQLGLAALASGALKVVVFDLAGAAFVWRALSFAGIGLVLIAGAFVYSRAQQRLELGPRPETALS